MTVGYHPGMRLLVEEFVAIENQRARLRVAGVEDADDVIALGLRIAHERGWNPVRVVELHVDAELRRRADLIAGDWTEPPRRRWWQWWRRS